MHEAKSNLSRLAERASHGEEIVIARNGRPVAKLVPYDEPLPPRRFGLWSGQVVVREDFDDPLPADVQRAFEGPDA